MNYNEFISTKKHSSIDSGIDLIYTNDKLMDFQRHIVEKCVKKGRYAGFIDTGLGKTLIELCIAKNYNIHTKKPVLIITPLAVAFQFIKEAEKFGIDGVSYSKDGSNIGDICICNYERIEKFDCEKFDCVILDESSILKNFDGKIKTKLTAFMRKIKYRYLFTATPSPNDYIELGTSSEALGNLGYTDMLTMFFKNNDNTIKQTRVSMARAGDKWYLKPHAEKDFWQWVTTWSISIRRPSDIGYSDERHKLPKLNEVITYVKNEIPREINGQMCLFNFSANNFFEIKQECNQTVMQRCEKSVDLSKKYENTVYWVNTNKESTIISNLDKSSVELVGSMSIDEKEEILTGFSSGDIKRLITKTSITAFGLNWQHCNHCTYFPNFSYEQYYQAIRRFWRFGQIRDVVVDLILSDGQGKMLKAIQAKKSKAEQMYANLVRSTTKVIDISKNEYTKNILLPQFIN